MAPPQDGLYYISNVMNSTYYVTYLKDTGDQNTSIVASQDTITLWDVSTISDTTTIRQYKQNNVFDVRGSSSDQGTPILLYPATTNPNQKWTINTVSGTQSIYTIQNVGRDNREIAMGNSPTPGDNPVTLEELNLNRANHQWKFTLWTK